MNQKHINTTYLIEYHPSNDTERNLHILNIFMCFVFVYVSTNVDHEFLINEYFSLVQVVLVSFTFRLGVTQCFWFLTLIVYTFTLSVDFLIYVMQQLHYVTNLVKQRSLPRQLRNSG